MSTSRTFALFVYCAALGAIVSVLASCGGGSSSSDATVTKVVVIPTVSSIKINGRQTFTANALDKDGNTVTGQIFSWSSSDSNVATIDSTGQATGVSSGSAKITAEASNVTSSPVTMTVLPSVGSVAITPTSGTIKVGAQQQFTATANDVSGKTITGAVFDWGLSFSGVATIDKTGLVTGVSAGTVLVTATTGGVTSPVATLNVTN